LAASIVAELQQFMDLKPKLVMQNS